VRQGGPSLYPSSDLKLRRALRELLRLLESLEVSEEACLEKTFMKETYLEGPGE